MNEKNLYRIQPIAFFMLESVGLQQLQTPTNLYFFLDFLNIKKIKNPNSRYPYN